MNEDLKYTFGNVNDWLKFAEAKNAGLLTLNIASLIGILQADSVFSGVKWLEAILIFFFSISTCICLYSILPIVDKGFKFYKKLNDEDFLKIDKSKFNILFFGDIANLSGEQFINVFEYKHQIKLSLSEKDFGNQITNNAERTMQKFSLFNRAAWISFSSFIVGILVVIVKAFS